MNIHRVGASALSQGVVAASTAAAALLLVVGCSSSSPTITRTPDTASSSAAAAQSGAETATATEQDAAVEPLGSSVCVEVTQANLDLAVASTKEEARKAGDILEKYDLPSGVKDAVEHFVGTGGAQFDDPDYSKNNDVIEKWVKAACP